MTKISISPNSNTLAALDQRGKARSTVLNIIIERYIYAIDRAMPRNKFSDQECGLILDALNGSLFVGGSSIRLLPAEIEDSLADGLAEKWQVDGPALVTKLKMLDYGQCLAVIDAVERYWLRVAKGEQLQPGELLTRF